MATSGSRRRGFWWAAFLCLDYCVFSTVASSVSFAAGFTEKNLVDILAEYFFSGAPLVIKGIFFPFYPVLLVYAMFLAPGRFQTDRKLTLAAVLGCFAFTYIGFLIVGVWMSSAPLTDTWRLLAEELHSWTCLEHDCNGIRASALLSSVISALLVHFFFTRLIRFKVRQGES